MNLFSTGLVPLCMLFLSSFNCLTFPDLRQKNEISTEIAVWDLPRISNYTDTLINMELPLGWTGQLLPVSDKHLVQLRPKTTSEVFVIVEVVPIQALLSTRKAEKFLGQLSKNRPWTFKGYKRGTKVMLFERDGGNIKAAVYHRRDMNRGQAYFGYLLGNSSTYEQIGEHAFLINLLDQIEPSSSDMDLRYKENEAEAILSQSGEYVISGQYYSSDIQLSEKGSQQPIRLARKDLINSWILGSIGANVQQRGNPSLGNTNQSVYKFHFNLEGAYTLEYRSTAISGVFRSETRITETGTYRLSGTELILIPIKHQGWIYAGSRQNKQQVFQNRSGPRHYSTYRHAGGIGLSGPCAPFQVDAFCRKAGKSPIHMNLYPEA